MFISCGLLPRSRSSLRPRGIARESNRNYQVPVDEGDGAKFDRKREGALAALLSQPSIEAAAKASQISTATLLRWLHLPEFQNAYREARRAAFGQSVARLQQASSTAVSVLLKIMVDTNAPTSSRVRAAESVLLHAAKAIEIEDVEVRVAALEQTMKSQQQGL